ncbi:TPA: Cd(II)-sensing metalloregulatory transcriptional repressor CadC, partial [Listeria monocytogenes]|nr:Cd(II)-sensing metalloregulatory transcriptional repressor CadC [Listeria monocytogenes]
MTVDICEITCIDEEKVKRVKTGLETVEVTTISQIFKILSDETRVKIVYALLTE